VIDVIRNGHPEGFALEPLANGVRLRVGQAGAVLPQGRHVYLITYRTSRHIGFLERHDELRWNVNGNGWSLALERITAEVTLPAGVPAREIKVEASTTDYQSFVRDGRAAFRSTRPLAPKEGMTIVVGFPKGLIAAPGIGQGARWFFADNWSLLTGLAVLALFLGFLWSRRRVKSL
jgi:hypothetical protein